MRMLYVVATWLLFVVLFPFLVLAKKTRDGLRQRLGMYPKNFIPEDGRQCIWLHGASAGDLLALSPMIDRLRDRSPNLRIVISTMTNTGYLMAQQKLRGKVDVIVYSPFDLWGATKRSVRALRPNILVLEYTEVWPNLVRSVRRSGGRVVMTNGRFSPQHVQKYRLFFSLIENPLRDFDLLLMREPEEAERARTLGAISDRVHVTGNTKFDALVPSEGHADEASLRTALGGPEDARLWIAGSTHEGEEEQILAVYKRLIAKEAPDLRLILAPRYIDRSDRIMTLIDEAGLEGGRRSTVGAAVKPVVVLDTIGELSRAYHLATVVFVGGSFTTRGGQNILEPAAQGKPVLFGPHMENFHDSVQVLVGRGGIQVNDADHLYRVMAELLSRPKSLASLGQLAKIAVSQVSGASDRNVDAILGLLRA
jgi:3-deoxy-D-manno-octulosonic-acid transferase